MEFQNAEKIRGRCKKIGVIVISIGLVFFISGVLIPREFLPVWSAFAMMMIIGLPMSLVGIPILLHGLFKKFSYVMMLALPIPLVFLDIILIILQLRD